MDSPTPKRTVDSNDAAMDKDHGGQTASGSLTKTQMKTIRKHKLGKTVLLVVVWVCFGMIHALGSPTLLEMRDRLNTTMEDMVLAFSFRNFGALLGSVLFGMMADRYRNKADLVMGLAVVLTGFPQILKPHVRSLWLMGVVSFSSGLGQGGLESVGIAMVHWLWGGQSDASFHALHFGYPVGTALAPLIAMPFLGADLNHQNTTDYNGNVSVQSNMTNGTDFKEPARIEIPFAIVGTFTCIIGGIFFILLFIGKPKGLVYHGADKTNFWQVFSPKSCRAMGSTGYTCSILFLVCIFYIFLNAKDGSLSTYVFAYAVESNMHFKKKEAAALDTTYRLIEVVGRALAVIVAHYCPIQPMILVSVYVNAVFTTCLALLGTRKKIYLWVCACLFKFTAAPVWPSGLAWTSKYITFSSMVVAVTQIALGITGYFFDWLGGHLYDLDPSYFMYYGMVCAYTLVGVLTTMQIVASCCARKEVNVNPTEDDKAPHETDSLMHAKSV